MAEAPDQEALDQLLKAYVNQTKSEQTDSEDELIQRLKCFDPSTWFGHLKGIQNGSGETAVHAAVRLEHTLLLELILSGLTDEQRLQLLEICKVTPLHTAASANYVESLKIIFKFLSADQWLELLGNFDENGHTALDYARNKQSRDSIKYLGEARKEAYKKTQMELQKKDQEMQQLKEDVRRLTAENIRLSRQPLLSTTECEQSNSKSEQKLATEELRMDECKEKPNVQSATTVEPVQPISGDQPSTGEPTEAHDFPVTTVTDIV